MSRYRSKVRLHNEAFELISILRKSKIFCCGFSLCRVFMSGLLQSHRSKRKKIETVENCIWLSKATIQ